MLPLHGECPFKMEIILLCRFHCPQTRGSISIIRRTSNDGHGLALFKEYRTPDVYDFVV